MQYTKHSKAYDIVLSMRKKAVILVLLASLILAGCSGMDDTTTTAQETLTESPSTPVDATTTHRTLTESPSTPTIDTINSSKVVAYENLTDRQQTAFHDALNGQATFGRNSSNSHATYDSDVEEPFETHDYILFEGSLYQTQVFVDDFLPQYVIYTSKIASGSNESTIAYSDLPKNIQDEVRVAITQDKYTSPAGKWSSLPDSIEENKYISYENNTYELQVAHGDVIITRIKIVKL